MRILTGALRAERTKLFLNELVTNRLLVKHFRFASQQMFDRFATSKNIAVQHYGTVKSLLIRKREGLAGKNVASCRNVASR